MGEIKKELVTGVFYTAIAKYIGIIINLMIIAVLARLLSPNEFGTVAISTVFINFFSIISNLGFGPAIIQNKNLNNKDYNNIFSLTIYLAIILSTVFYLSSWYVAEYYNERLLITIFQLLSINIFFATLNVVPNSLILKDKKFKFIAIRTLIIQLFGGMIAIYLAYNNYGIYSLLVNPIFSSIALFIVNYKTNPLHFNFNIKLISIKKIISFSTYQFLFNFINYFSRNLDKLLIGKFIGMNELGYYEKSYSLMMLPLSNITNVITPVMHPIFSEYQNDKAKLLRSYINIIKLLAFIGLPLSVFLIFNANNLVLLIFGNQWQQSVPVFRILSITVGIQVIVSSSGSIFQATGATKQLFISGLLSTITNVFGLLFCLYNFKSIEAIAWGICITFYINFFQSYYILFVTVFKTKFKTFIKILIHPSINTILLYVILMYINLHINIENNLLSLTINTIILLATVMLYVQLFHIWNIKLFITNKIKQIK